MVNLDMVGRLGETLTVYGTSTGNGFEEMTDRIAANHKLKIKKIPGGRGPSDHASFHAAGVPVFHLFTGLHSDYHRPSDDFEKLNVGGMRRIARMTVDMVMELASSTEKTRVAKGTTKTSRAIKGSQTKKPDTVTLPAGTTTLGIGVVDAKDRDGCLVSTVKPGGPAEQAGVREGDIIVSVDAKQISEIGDIKSTISRHAPDDTVTLRLLRGKIPLTIKVKLGVVK